MLPFACSAWECSALASSLAAILLATDVWYLNLSRSGWNCIDVCFYMLMAVLFLLLAFDALSTSGERRYRKWIYFGARGFCCARGLYGYPAARAIKSILVASLAVAILIAGSANVIHYVDWQNKPHTRLDRYL